MNTIQPMTLEIPARGDMTEFHDRRRQGIGGSDAGAILGVNPYKSRFEVYLDKIGESEPFEDNEYCYWGRELEDRIAKEFALRTDWDLVTGSPPHEGYVSEPFMIGYVDRTIFQDGKWGILECKQASVYMLKKWQDDGVPLHYQAQCHHYMAVMGYPVAYIAVLFGGNEFRAYEIPRDEALIEQLIEAERSFWFDHVQARIPPEMDGTVACTKAIKALYPQAEDEQVLLHAEVADMIRDYNDAKIEMERWNDIKTANENKIKDRMGTAVRGIAGPYAVSWSNVKGRESFDTKRLKLDNPELHAEYSKTGAPSRRFSIKQVEEME